MLRRIRSVLTILIMAVMIATSFGVVAAPEVDAASGLPKVSSLSASAGEDSVTLSWAKLGKKQLKKVKGIAIFRDGDLIGTVGKKATSFTDSGLWAGTDYSYSVKTYKATNKKEWFNKQTQRWQKKKPAKKWRGKSRKACKYSGGTDIDVVTTEGAAQSGSDDAQGGTTGSTGNKTQHISCNGNHTLTIGQKYNLGGSASSGLPVTYMSQDPSVAIVNESGVVTAVSAGRTVVYIRQAGNEIYTPVETYATITVKGNQDQDPGTNPGPGTDPGSGTDPNPGSDPVVVTDPFTVNIPSNMKFDYNGWNVITLNQGEVKIPVTVPKHVARIDWTETNAGLAQSKDTITHRTADNGKELYLTANDTLSDRSAFGQLRYTGTLVMEDGYQYYDKNGDGTVDEGDRRVSFVIVNTIYPVSGKTADNIHYVYDFKDMQPVVARNGLKEYGMTRVVELKAENLPDGSHVNIDIGELNADSGFETQLLFPTMSDATTRNGLELVTPQANWECMVFRSKSLALVLLQTGSFTMKYPSGRKITFKISGRNPETLERYNKIKNIGNQCISSTELETIRKCIRYSLLNYTYSATVQDMHGRQMGDCISSNSYFVEVLRYCGIRASLRFSGPEKGENSNHYNIAVILKDGTKYVVDCTPVTPSWYKNATYEWDSYESFEHDDRLITWDKYSKNFIIDMTFGYDDDEEVMIKVR